MEFENCENEMEYISVGSNELMREFALKLICGVGNRPTAGRCFPPSLVRNAKVFLRQRSMIPWCEFHRPRLNEVGGGQRGRSRDAHFKGTSSSFKLCCVLGVVDAITFWRKKYSGDIRRSTEL